MVRMADDLPIDAALSLLMTLHTDIETSQSRLTDSLDAEGCSGAKVLVVHDPVEQAFEEALHDSALPTLQELTDLFSVLPRIEHTPRARLCAIQPARLAATEDRKYL